MRSPILARSRPLRHTVILLLVNGVRTNSLAGTAVLGKNTELTLIDKLSRLSYQQTVKLLGSNVPKLLRAGFRWDFRIEEDVDLGPDLFRLKFPSAVAESESAPLIVTITLAEPSYGRLQWHCLS